MSQEQSVPVSPFPTTTHFVIDLETFAVVPTAVVLSIGMAEFVECEASNPPISSIRTVQYNLSISEQILASRTLDPTTISWWLDRPKKVQELTSCEAMPTLKAVAAVFGYIEVAKEIGNKIKVWGNSPSFDLRILESLANDFGVRNPWSYRDEADIRTVTALLGKKPQVQEGLEHTAKADALAEAELLREALVILRTGSKL